MKVLFLDIDGVMNNARFNDYWCRMFNRGVSDCIDPMCVRELNRIIDATGCKVVISSSWRLWISSVDTFNIVLGTHGFVGEVVGLTPCRNVTAPGDTHRAREIRQYILDHPEVNYYVVLDDDTEPVENFIKVDNGVGLSPKDADKAIRMLGGVMP